MKENSSYEAKEKITNTFLKTVSAFANYGSGVIEFGIKDDGNIVGVENVKDACLIIENKINDSIRPVPEFLITVDDKTNVITLNVKEGKFKPYYYNSKAYRRTDTSSVEVDYTELNRLILEGEHRFFDEQIAENQDLQFSKLEEKMQYELNIESLNIDILKTVGLVNIDGLYNNAGALLADTNSFSGIDCVRFGETIDIILDREIIQNKSILSQYDETIRLYQKYYQYDEIKGSVRTRVELIPEKAFREAIANALVHREWDVKSHIRVAMYNDRIEVYSPGGLSRGITELEYLEGQVSILRNPVIGGVLFRLNIIESFGTGIQRMNLAYKDSDVKPSHYFSENAIKVILPIFNSCDNLSKDEKVVFGILDKFGKPSSKIIDEVGFGKNKTLKILTILEEKGYVRKIGRGRATKYII